MFKVGVSWQNPNDPGGDPECWLPKFSANVWVTPGINVVEIIEGLGTVTLLDPGQPGIDTCCYYPLRCNGNDWEIITYPVTSGRYRVDLFIMDFEWDLGSCPWCADCFIYKYCDWGEYSWKFVHSEYIKVNNEAADILAISDLFYVSSDDQDTIRNGSTMEVANDYDIVCRIVTSKSLEEVPLTLTGYLEPEDVLIPTQKVFVRDPAGDETVPCNQHYPYKTYSYRCYDGFMPYTLFPHIEPPEWSELTRYLDCKMYAQENNALNDKSIRTWIMAGLQLDCINDSTVSFRPAAGEKMEFIFRYGREMGLTPEMDIRFRISDKDGVEVYDEPIFLPLGHFWNENGFPGISPYSIPLSWGGRANVGDNAGHLADPALDSYQAKVLVLNQAMETNTESFDVIPMIDSVLVTNYPWFPPPFLRDGIDIYSLIRGKIDDSGILVDDYRCYIPQGETLPSQVTFWNGIDYKYWDLPAVWHQVFYYRDLGSLPINSVYNWDNAKWGDLSFKWYWVDDYAESGGNGGNWWQKLYYDNYDMTSFWGDNWKIRLQGELNWSNPTLNAEMRFLIRSQAINFKNSYLLQEVISPDSTKAHLVITGPASEPLENWDIRDWAITQMGTPYWTFPKEPYRYKDPYILNDCSGLVISGRIQDIGIAQNECHRINHIAVCHIVQNYYPYPPPPDPGPNVPLELTEITEAEAEPNDIILIAEKRKPFSHVVIINSLRKYNGVISEAYIIHAWGKEHRNLRQVRINELLTEFSRYSWDYKFMRFEEF